MATKPIGTKYQHEALARQADTSVSCEEHDKTTVNYCQPWQELNFFWQLEKKFFWDVVL